MRRFILIPFLFFSLILSATDYYVKTGGDDSNTGFSDAQAWAHHPWMHTWTGLTVLQPGDNIYMNKGDTWTTAVGAHYLTVAQSGTAGNYITTSSYGDGATPILNISSSNVYAVIYGSGKSFVKFNGLEITHNSSVFGNGYGILMSTGADAVPHDWTITNCIIHNIPFAAIWTGSDAYNITVGDITATETATTINYSNHIYDFGYAGVMLLGGNVSTGRSDYKVYYNYIHNSTRTGYPIDTYGIQASASGSSDMYPHYVWMNYNRVENIVNHEALGTHGCSYLYIQDNYIKNTEDAISIFAYDNYGFDAMLDHVYIDRNTFEQPANPTYPTTNIRLYYNPTYNYVLPEYIYIRDNTFFFTTRPTSVKHSGIYVYGIDDMEISGNNFYNGPTVSSFEGACNGCGPAIYFVSSSNNYFKDVTIKNNFIKDWTPTNIRGSGIQGIFNFENNIINVGNTPGVPIYVSGTLPAAGRLNIYNNSLLSGSTPDNVIQINSSVSGSIINIKNNICGKTSSGSFYYIYTYGTISGTLNCDYNLYWNSSSTYPFYTEAAPKTFTQWKALGYDAHSPNVSASLDPVFLNAGGSYALDTDFELDESSPAIDVGTDTGLDEDYAEDPRPVNTFFDIGAYEFQEEMEEGVYFVATDGDDGGTGAIDDPWASWSKIGDITLVPGDIVYIRGGTYRTTGDGSTTVHVRWDGINGTINDTIKIMAYPGETPILNLDNITQTAQYSYIIFIQNSNYLHIKGLRVTGLPQQPYGNSGTLSYGFRLSGSSHNLIEFNEADHLAFRGYDLGSGSNYNLFLNSDAHHLKDPYSYPDPYGGADGFGRTGGSTATGNVFRNCRAWLCSDDGWDHYSTDGYTYIEGCWSFWNGYLDEARTQPAGDGTGFKLGPGNTNLTIASRIVTNCLAVQNRANGLDQNFYEGVGEFASHIYNNTMYGNGQYGFRMRPYGTSNGSNADIIRNNVAYSNTAGTYLGDAGDTQDHNTWNGLVTLTSADFVSLNTAVLDDARQADGSLPDITLLHLATGSDLIDAGIDVGLPYENAPDMGCFEYIGGIQIVLPTVTTTIISGIGDSYATGGGNVTSSGNGTVSARGVCWYTSLNPTILYDHTTDGTGIGAFASSLTDLYEYTHYYVRAYATNEIGTSYGSNREFTTLEHEEPEPPPGVGIILIDKDGNVLKSPDGIHLLKPNNP